MDSAGRSWEKIFREVSFRAKKFNACKSEAETLPEGIILNTNFNQIEQEFDALSDTKKKGEWLGENWYWVFLPIIEKIIDQTCWICLGLFEYEGLQEKPPRWLYFTTGYYINKVLTIFSLIGRTDFFDKNLKENVILSLPFYQEIQEKEIENERNTCQAEIFKTRPFCIELDKKVELPEGWQQKDKDNKDSKFAVVADWHDAFNELKSSEVIKTYHADIGNQSRLIDFLKEEAINKKYLPELFVRGTEVANKIPSHFMNSEITRYKKRIGNYLAMMHDSSEGDASLILTVPSWRPPGEKRRFISVALIACFKKPQPNSEALPLDKVVTAMELGSSNLSLFVFGFLNKELEKHATKSAIAAIISRNGSHNIGSHVINRVVESIDTANIQDNKFFYRYLQQRMDFVAQISTDFHRPTTAHWFVKEIMKGFYEQRHLLDNIARSEGLKGYDGSLDNTAASDDLEIYKGGKGNGHGEVIHCIIKRVNRWEISSKDWNKEPCIANNGHGPIHICDAAKCEGDLSKDLLVSIPGGPIGFHAFYTILENFIRNAAKHCFASHPAKDRHMEIWVELLNFFEDHTHFTVRIWDNYSYVSGAIDTDLPCLDYDVRDLDAGWEQLTKIWKQLTKITVYIPQNAHHEITLTNDGCGSTVEINTLPFEEGTTRFPELQEDHIVFVVDDGVICRENGYYEELCKKPNIRFVEKVYWDEFIKDSPKIPSENLLKFLKKYYTPAHWLLNKAITEALIDRKGKLKKKNWGICEMEIAAGYLQGLNPERIGMGGRENLEEIIKAIPVPECKDQIITAYRLGYEFRMKKPAEVQVVTASEINKIPWNEHGVHIKNLYDKDIDARMLVFCQNGEKEEDFLWLLEKVLVKNNSHSLEELKLKVEDYQRFAVFVVADDELNKQLSETPNIFIKKRVIPIGKEEFRNQMDNDPESFKIWLLRKWIDHLRERVRDLAEGEICLVFNPTLHGRELSSQKELTMMFLEAVLKKTIEKLRIEKNENEIKKVAQEASLAEYPTSVVYSKCEEWHKDFNKTFNTYWESVESLQDILQKRTGLYDSTYIPPTVPKILTDNASQSSSGDGLNQLYAISCFGRITICNEEQLPIQPQSTIRYKRHNKCDSQENYLYCEDLSGAAPHFPQLLNPPKQEVGSSAYPIYRFAGDLIENALLRIAVADERVYETVVAKGHGFDELKCAGIQFVSMVLDVKMGDHEQCMCIEEKDGRITLELNGAAMPDILIIHQGILDKINPSQLDKIAGVSSCGDETPEEKFISALKDIVPFIVITSGRGRPEKLPAGVKFVPFSLIEATLLARPHSKLTLVRQLL